MRVQILIVDDEQLQRETLGIYLQKKGYNIHNSASGNEAIEYIRSNQVDIVISDQKMPHMSGLELARYIKENHPNMSVIIITAFGSIEDAVNAMKDGVEDYLIKPVNLNELSIMLERILEKRMLISENKKLREAVKNTTRLPNIIYESEIMEEVMGIVVRASESNATVLITGESGTGKELIARAIHELSERKHGPFIAVNCAAIPENLIENEFFGHEKGAYTGADGRFIGKFEQANGGTIFLDEIGEIPQSIQVKLLRVLQEREFQRVGGLESIKVDVRIITATNRDIEKEVREGLFRNDLYYRLNVIGIEIPSLRKRRSDIPALVEHFMKHYSHIHGRHITSISSEALDLLVKYQFPGNIRELGNIIEQVVVLSRDNVIRVSDLPARISSPQADENENRQLKDSISDLERKKILEALRQTKGNKSAAARLLGVSEGKIRHLLKKYQSDHNSLK
jgi:DNA-binding NtrC family response regulator